MSDLPDRIWVKTWNNDATSVYEEPRPDAIEYARVPMPIQGHCATCVHWEPFDPQTIESGTGQKLLRANRLGLCRKVSDAVKREEDLPDDIVDGKITPNPPDGTLAMVVDASDYVHEMRTAETFGCVLHETAPR